MLYVCMCVCVCVWRKKGRKRDRGLSLQLEFGMSTEHADIYKFTNIYYKGSKIQKNKG